MQDISKMLGQTPGAGAPSPQQPAPPVPAEDEQRSDNPLEKMSELTKEKPKKKGTSVTEEMDEETIKQILMSGENSEGLFTPDKKTEDDKELHEEIDEDAKLKTGEVKEQSQKYSKRFREDISKNPDKYKVMTPKGEMTVREAMAKGYNPLTRRFEKDKTAKEIVEKHKKNLNEADKGVIDTILDPKSANIAPADAEQMGLPADSPMIRQEQPQALPGQAPVANEVPQPSATPATGGAPDLTALLGGAS